jgi:hypothetical protein
LKMMRLGLPRSEGACSAGAFLASLAAGAPASPGLSAGLSPTLSFSSFFFSRSLILAAWSAICFFSALSLVRAASHAAQSAPLSETG